MQVGATQEHINFNERYVGIRVTYVASALWVIAAISMSALIANTALWKSQAIGGIMALSIIISTSAVVGIAAVMIIVARLTRTYADANRAANQHIQFSRRKFLPLEGCNSRCAS